MSIVGTRPPLISETNLYEPRHKVKVDSQRDFFRHNSEVKFGRNLRLL